jgi:hypothetical protein
MPVAKIDRLRRNVVVLVEDENPDRDVALELADQLLQHLDEAPDPKLTFLTAEALAGN